MEILPLDSQKRPVALSVVIPCYNENTCLEELYKRVTAVCKQHAQQSYEIVLVNDGSTDDTGQIIRGLTKKDHHVVGIDLARNYGHQIALSAGLELSCGERILILDADLQDPPELLAKMAARMDEGFDVVYGQRQAREGEGWFKQVSAKVFYRMLGRMVDVYIAPDTGDFRLMNRRALDHLNAMPERFRFIRGMVSWIGLRQTALPYIRQERFAGKTHYPLRKMFALAIDAITSFSVVPLRFASHLGFFLGLMGLATLGYMLFAWATGDVVRGWTSLAALIVIIGSVQLLVLGIFGEYLGRMYMEAKRRPLYIINEVIAAENHNDDEKMEARQLQEKLKVAVDA